MERADSLVYCIYTKDLGESIQNLTAENERRSRYLFIFFLRKLRALDLNQLFVCFLKVNKGTAD